MSTDQHKIKVTLKDTDVIPIPSGFTLHPKKTLLHKDSSSISTTGKKGSKEEGAAVAINCVTFN
jgi:hypothetical protein